MIEEVKVQSFATSGDFEERASEFVTFLRTAPEGTEMAFTRGWLSNAPDRPQPDDPPAVVCVVNGRPPFVFSVDEAMFIAELFDRTLERFPGDQTVAVMERAAAALRETCAQLSRKPS